MSHRDSLTLGHRAARAHEWFHSIRESDGGRTLRRYDSPMQSILTARELEIAQLVALGKTNRAIASTLCLSPRTVENHLYSVYSKLGIGCRIELALAVLRAA